MKKQLTSYVLICLTSALFCLIANDIAAKTFSQLYFTDFNSGFGEFDLNNMDLSFGDENTTWIVNDQYDGGNIYPETPEQLLSDKGKITDAPKSLYLHTFNKNEPDYANANYNINGSSDVFAVINDEVNTFGFSKVKFSFYYTGGEEEAYLQVYIIHTGLNTWQPIGDKLYGASNWEYIELDSENWANRDGLRFGFRFINNDNGQGQGKGIGIDDVMIVAEYDEVNNPVTIEITSVPVSICEGKTLPISFEMSDTLSTGTYYIELSDSTGNFPPTAVWSTSLPYPLTQGSFNLGLPSWILPGDCYKVRIHRVGIPEIIGEASICFEIKDCDNTIVTNGPPLVLTDPDDPWKGSLDLPSICAGSVIDVQSNSWGVFYPDNEYVLQLSNPDGTWDFGTFWENIGSVEDDNQYPSIPPGGTGGHIPMDVPEGCNYYIRVVSTEPKETGEAWGPFCIRQCDIMTNAQEDINICISEEEGASIDVAIDINVWDEDAVYAEENDFMVELRDMLFFSLVSYGDWLKTGKEAGTFTMEVPKVADLISQYGIKPGGYYMRIVGTNSSETDDLWGTWIHLFIGAPASDPTQLSVNPTEFNQGGISCFTIVSPQSNPNSIYNWFIDGELQGTWPGMFTTRCWRFEKSGEKSVQVQEVSYGCLGPLSNPVMITVNPLPSTQITGTDTLSLCQGQTACYEVSAVAGTFYDWTVEGAKIIEDNLNQICIKVEEDVTEVTLTLAVVNETGFNKKEMIIPVDEAPDLNNPGQQYACEGFPLTLAVQSNAENLVLLDSEDNIIAQNDNPFVFTPTQSGTYTLIATINGMACERSESFNINLLEPINEIVIEPLNPNEEFCLDGTYIFYATPIEGTDYSWTTEGIEVLATDENKITFVINEKNISMNVTAESPCGELKANYTVEDIDCIVGLEDEMKNQSLISAYCYPNPTENKTTKLFYTLKDKSYHVKFCLYDLSGRKVMEQVLPFAQNSLTLNLSEQANAMYLFTLETEEGSILKSGKLINR